MEAIHNKVLTTHITFRQLKEILGIQDDIDILDIRADIRSSKIDIKLVCPRFPDSSFYDGCDYMSIGNLLEHPKVFYIEGEILKHYQKTDKE